MTRRLTVLREVFEALTLAMYLLARQRLAPVKGIAYLGRHRVSDGLLSTMQDRWEHANAQAAGAAALESARMVAEILRPALDRRTPGALLSTFVGRPAQDEADTLAAKGLLAGWLVRTPEHVEAM